MTKKYDLNLRLKLLFITFFLSAICAALTKDKKELYRKYPQLLSPETDPCVRGINQLLINMKTSDSYE